MTSQNKLTKSLLAFLPCLVVALPLLLIVYIPRPPVAGAQFIIFPVIAFAGAVLITTPSSIRKNAFNMNKVGVLMLIILSQAVIVSLSQFINFDSIRVSSLATIFKPFLILILFLLGVLVTKRIDSKKIYRGLYLSGVIIIFGQIIISIPQILNIPVFDVIYSGEKTRGIGRIFRITGSIYNPNMFALLLTQAALLVLLFGERSRRYIWIILAFMLIIGSGSRSVLLLFPIAILCALLFSNQKISPKRIIKLSFAALIGLSVIFYIVYIFSDTFQYLGQLLVLFDAVDITAIRTISLRLEMWEIRWAAFHADESIYKWLIGLGSRDIFRVSDNDYLYVIWHFGIIGFIMHTMLYFVLFFQSFKSYSKELKSLCITCLLLLVILGFLSETLVGWLQPLTTIYFIGIAIGFNSKIKVNYE